MLSKSATATTKSPSWATGTKKDYTPNNPSDKFKPNKYISIYPGTVKRLGNHLLRWHRISKIPAQNLKEEQMGNHRQNHPQ